MGINMASQLDMFGGDSVATPSVPKRKSASVMVPAVPLSHPDMAAALEASGDYRILRRMPKMGEVVNPRPGFPRIGVVLDTETTGLRKAEDEIIEIGAIAFSFDDTGVIGDVVGTFGALQQPTGPIPAEITKLTGITDEMVAGQAIAVGDLECFLAPADLIIAHNAAFDRPFCERLSPIFADKAWACSNNEVDWRGRGFEGTKLGYLLSQSGLFHDGHRAVDDCYALLEVLRKPDGDGLTPFAELLVASRRERVRIWAEYSPFEKKDDLKARGYKWSNGEGQQPKAWWTEIDAATLDDELTYLREQIYGRADIEATVKHLTAIDRFKA